MTSKAFAVKKLIPIITVIFSVGAFMVGNKPLKFYQSNLIQHERQHKPTVNSSRKEVVQEPATVSPPVVGSNSSSTNLSLPITTSPKQQKWIFFEMEANRTLVVLTARFSRTPNRWKSMVHKFQKRIISGGLDASNVFGYADVFPDFILSDARWRQHLAFLRDNSKPDRGAGYWFFKAVLIRHHLEFLKDGDFLLYADTDLDADGDLYGMDRLIGTMIESRSNLAVWRYPNKDDYCCPEKNWNKRDVYEAYCPDRDQSEDFSGQFQGGWILIKKQNATLQLIDDWIEGVSNFHFVSDEPSILPNVLSFKEHRHDQSIWSLLLKCRYNESGLTQFDPSLPGRKSRIHMLSIQEQAR